MTDGGEDDYDEEGSHHLVRGADVIADRGGWRDGRREGEKHSERGLKRVERLRLQKVNTPELFMATDVRASKATHE